MIEDVSKDNVLVAPLYKGLVNTTNPDHVALFKGVDPSTGEKMEREAYLRMLSDNRGTAPELTQDIARAASAALLASDHKRKGENARLISVEGCLQQIGDRKLYGAEIMEGIWRNVVPKEVMRDLGALQISTVSACTIREVKTILEELDRLGGGRVIGITHDYHRPRVNTMFEEEVDGNQTADVFTPEEAVGRLRIDQPYEQFVVDMVKAGAPLPEIVAKERKMEKIYGPLHWISRHLEQLTGEKFNLEEWLANRARKDHK